MKTQSYDGIKESKCTSQPNALIEALPCGLILLGRDLSAEMFNGELEKFFSGVCVVYKGLSFDDLAGALRDMEFSEGLGEADLLAHHIRAFEECTVDYRRHDGKFFRISSRPVQRPDGGMLLTVTDISDITESEFMFAELARKLTGALSSCRARLKLADALISARERERLEKQFSSRMSSLCDRVEDALMKGEVDAALAELGRRSGSPNPRSPAGTRKDFVKRLKKSLRPEGCDAAPRVVLRHADHPACGAVYENGIIEAVREGVLTVTVCSKADVVYVSLWGYDGGMELSIHSGGPVVRDFEFSAPYISLANIAEKMCAELRSDTSNGFDLSMRCSFPVKTDLPSALVVLGNPESSDTVCETLGGGADPILRCIAASSAMDICEACGRYAPAVLIAESELIEKHARALKTADSKMKIIAISSPGEEVGLMANLYIDGILPRFAEAETLRAAVSSVMLGFSVRACGTPFERADSAARRHGLSETERSIIELAVKGMSNEKIAAELHYSRGSLRNMFSAIYVKLGISDRAQLTAFAILNGFL